MGHDNMRPPVHRQIHMSETITVPKVYWRTVTMANDTGAVISGSEEFQFTDSFPHYT